MIMRKHLLPVAVALVAVVPPALAEEEQEPGWWLPGEFSGGVSVTNNYVFRGITQSDDDPAIQGSITYTLDTGFEGINVFAGVWGSNVDFDDGDGAHVELDWSFGLTGDIGETGLSYTLAGIYYHYPAQGEYNYWEIAPSLSYTPPQLDMLTVLAGLNYSPDNFNGTGNAYYLNGGVQVAIPIPNNLFTLTLEGYTGHQWIENNSKFGAEDYQDWKLGLSVGIKNITLSAYYTDTNLSKSDCGGTNNCDSRAVLALGALF
jgi:uncharacterized protein (TIGR02001 family)